MGQALLTTLQNGLGAELWTEKVKAAWTDVYGTVASTMKAGAAEKKPEETPVEAVKRTWALVAQDVDGAGVALFKGVWPIIIYCLHAKKIDCMNADDFEIHHGRPSSDILSLRFAEIFAIAPGAVDLFSFKDEPDMYNSDKFMKHARGVMNAVGMAVAGLDDVAKLVPVLKELGAKHVAYGVVDAHCELPPKCFGMYICYCYLVLWTTALPKGEICNDNLLTSDSCVLNHADDVVGQALLTTLENGLGAELWTEPVKAAWTDVYGTVASTMKAGAAEQR